ncbi:MAG: FecR domain-containing protein [Bacteroidota bacterium]
MSDVDTLYARWLSGEISPEEEKALKESGEWAELEAIIQALDGMTLPAYNVPEAYTKLKLQQNVGGLARSSQSFLWMGAVAAAACIALLLYFTWNGANQITEFSADLTENTQGALPDGSSFILNDGSSLQFKEGNWEEQRTLNLQGEAFFRVKTGKTFQVHTTRGSVEVVGTEFNVRIRKNVLAVECYEGKVSVSNGKENALIEAGESLKIENGQMGIIASIDHRKPYWTQGNSDYKEEVLNEVFEEMARQYSIQVIKPDLMRRFSGSFTHSNISLALDQVCKPMGLTYSFSEDKQIVTILDE